MKAKYSLVLFLFLVKVSTAQTGLDSILFSVSVNNKSIQAATQYYDSQAMLYQTGNAPDDPTVGIDYMNGSPAAAGNQLDFTVTQSFDFPTVYSNKKDLVETRSDQGQYQIQAIKQSVLLETKLVCLELIYLNKLHALLSIRITHAEKIYTTYNAKFEQNDGSVIELNKAKINLFNLQNELRLNEGKISGWNQKLLLLNGGIPITFKDTLYPFMQQLPPFEELELLHEQQDPLLKSLEQQLIITDQEVELNKSLWLPGFEVGYHYQSILGQTYNGVHVGMTIPLWEHNNTVAQKQLEAGFYEVQIDEHKNEHYFELKQLYENYLALRYSYSEYINLIASLTSVTILEKALDAGEITVIEFFVELSTYYSTYDNMLAIEKEYHAVVAQLTKYLL